ncbi:MAG: DDE-type integrase/transposase/recombinase [Acidobacteriia bacterium]|nr:DDE-type integrase/transposase/recombinase [Terriglobia bacterium]
MSEQDRRAIKQRVKAEQGFREIQAAQRTIHGYEATRMIRNGQARRMSGSDPQYDSFLGQRKHCPKSAAIFGQNKG